MARESVAKAYAVTMGLAIVCSVLVSAAAVGLRPMQEAARDEFIRKNILMAAGLYGEISMREAFAEGGRVETRIVDLASGEYVSEDEIDPAQFDQRAAARDPDLSKDIAAEADVARIGRREKYSLVYLVKNEQDQIDQVILPVRGKGLWSTMYGFISLDYGDLNTVRGITFYDHGETPGLGGEIENPRWRAHWVDGKRIYNDQGDVELRVVKTAVDPQSPAAVHQIDALSGSTLTADGVSNLVEYWFGADAFKVYLDRLRNDKQGTAS